MATSGRYYFLLPPSRSIDAAESMAQS